MEETKRRGRPARDENDTQSNLCTIKDPNMEPFYIVKDATNFTVMELSTSMRGFAGKQATGKEVEKIIGHYSNFSNALNRVAKEKFYQMQRDTTRQRMAADVEVLKPANPIKLTL
jgi:hypothetical protein